MRSAVCYMHSGGRRYRHIDGLSTLCRTGGCLHREETGGGQERLERDLVLTRARIGGDVVGWSRTGSLPMEEANWEGMAQRKEGLEDV